MSEFVVVQEKDESVLCGYDSASVVVAELSQDHVLHIFVNFTGTVSLRNNRRIKGSDKLTHKDHMNTVNFLSQRTENLLLLGPLGIPLLKVLAVLIYTFRFKQCNPRSSSYKL